MISPILIFVLAIGFLLLAILYLELHPFLALLLTGLLVGVAQGLPPPESLDILFGGFADTLRWISIVMILGTVTGEILAETGGALRLSETILRWVGRTRLPWAMALTGYVVAIPVFVDVAYIMLRPVTESLARQSLRPVVQVGLSLTAGLTATHALIPPTPGPLAVASILNADLGKVILLNAGVALFATVGGVLFAVYGTSRTRRDHWEEGVASPGSASSVSTAAASTAAASTAAASTAAASTAAVSTAASPPSSTTQSWTTFWSFAAVLVPLVLIAGSSFLKQDAHGALTTLAFLGQPTIALTLGMVLAAQLLARPGRKQQLNRLVGRGIEQAAIIIFITGAGGALGRILIESDIAESVGAVVQSWQGIGPLLPFLLALLLTTATGSLTVSMVTSSSIVLPLLPQLGLPAEWAAAAIGAGSLGIIHANSSFFWLFGRMHRVATPQLYRTLVLQSATMALSAGVGVLSLWILYNAL